MGIGKHRYDGGGTLAGGDTVWVTTPDLNVIHQADAEYRSRPLPVNELELLHQLIADNYEFSYFINLDGELWEIFGAAIQDPNFWRNETPVVGYSFIGHNWDQEFLAKLGLLTRTQLEVLPAALNLTELASDELIFSALTFHHPILGINGEVIATIRGTFSAPAIEKLNDPLHRNLIWGGVVFTLLLIGVGSILGLTIVQPLGRIIRSLDTRDPVHLSHLLVTKSDFGEIARLISSQFRRGRMLQEELRDQGLASTLPRFEKHLQNLAAEAATFRVSPDAFEGCSRATQIQLLYLIR